MGYAKKHIISIIAGLIVALICAVLLKTYRLYIYENHINDFHLADTIPNWFAIPAGTLFLWGVSKGKDSIKKIILSGIVGLIIFEFIFSATIDYLDIIATILSGGITVCIYKIYKYLQTRNI